MNPYEPNRLPVEPMCATKWLVEPAFTFALHKAVCGVCRLHKQLRDCRNEWLGPFRKKTVKPK